MQIRCNQGMENLNITGAQIFSCSNQDDNLSGNKSFIVGSSDLNQVKKLVLHYICHDLHLPSNPPKFLSQISTLNETAFNK